jgi:hypothetical protein
MTSRGGAPGGPDPLTLAAALGRLERPSSGQVARRETFVTLGNRGDATTGNRDGTAESLKQEPDVPGPVSPDSEGDLNDVPGVISESLDETIRHTGEWLIEKTAEILAHAIAPGAGHLVVLFFEGKELFEDVVALTSSDSPVELHIPLTHLPFEFELEAGVECEAKGDGDEADDGPRLILFMAPGDGGVLGGWALERKADEKDKKKEHRATLEGVAIAQADLSAVLDETDQPDRRTAILRGTAARLQSDLWARPEYRGISLIVIDDERSGLGLWLARSEAAVGMQRVLIVRDAQTGRLAARIVTST